MLNETVYSLAAVVAACGMQGVSSAATNKALQVGLAAELLCGKWAEVATGPALDRIASAAASQQIDAYFDRIGRVVGVVLWSMQTLPTKAGAMAAALTSTNRDAANVGSEISALGATLQITALVASRGWELAVEQVARSTSRPAAMPVMRDDLQGAKRESFTRSVQIGHALLALHRANHAMLNLPLPQTLRRITHSLHLEQLDLHFAASGDCVGWLSWAWLSDAGLGLLRRLGPSALHPSQWDEGLQPCIIDHVMAAPLNPAARSAQWLEWLHHWQARTCDGCATEGNEMPMALLRYESSPRDMVCAWLPPTGQALAP